jgi:hypothetical protein
VGESLKWAEFAMLAEGHRRAGMLDQAEQVLRSGLEEHPESPEGSLVLALVLLDREREGDARSVIESWADTNLGVEVADESSEGDSFGADVSEGELESAFASAETDRDEVIDADKIAQQAMMETEMSSEEEFVSPDSSFATRTVADLLSQQGDEQGASKIRAIVDSAKPDEALDDQNPKALQIERLERWLSNIRGAVQ